MAHPGERIRDIAIEDDMKDAYLRYAMSVIIARALPDVRDGLKPSQRRILVAMNDLNLGPRSAHRKCAKIAGDTSGNYHPHGQEVVYPTLVRMGQDFNSRYPLVDSQGNFGSPDGDPPPGAPRPQNTQLDCSGLWAALGTRVEFTPLREGFAKALAPFKREFAASAGATCG